MTDSFSAPPFYKLENISFLPIDFGVEGKTCYFSCIFRLSKRIEKNYSINLIINVFKIYIKPFKRFNCNFNRELSSRGENMLFLLYSFDGQKG